MSPERRPARPRAIGDGTNRNLRAAARTRSAVSARTGCGTGPGERTRETVAMDTPAARATSVIVVLATSAILKATFAGGGDVGAGKRFPESACRARLEV